MACSAVKDRGLAIAGRGEAEPLVGERGGAAAPLGSLEKSLLDEVRLVYVLQRPRILPHRDGHGAESHRPAAELLDDGGEDARVHVVEAELVHIEAGERRAGDRDGDPSVGPYL